MGQGMALSHNPSVFLPRTPSRTDQCHWAHTVYNYIGYGFTQETFEKFYAKFEMFNNTLKL